MSDAIANIAHIILWLAFSLALVAIVTCLVGFLVALPVWLVARVIHAKTFCLKCPNEAYRQLSYFELKQPPVRPVYVLGKECCKVKTIFDDVVKKLQAEGEDLTEALLGCKYCYLRPQFQASVRVLSIPALPSKSWFRNWILNREFPFRTFGFADKLESRNDPRLIVGFEPWMVRLFFWAKPFMDSSARHELEHVRQERDAGWLSDRWDPALTSSAFTKLWLKAELLALSRSLFATFCIVIPIVVFSVTIALHVLKKFAEWQVS